MIYGDIFKNKTNEELFLEYSTTKSSRIKQELVLRYIHIVKNIAIQMRGVYVDFTQIEDIVNEGVLALMSSIDKFDLSKNIKFETYISKRIKGLIIDIARKNDWVPRSVRKNSNNIEKTKGYLFTVLGRVPTDKEICDYLNISLEKYQDELKKINLMNLLSLENIIEENIYLKKTSALNSSDVTTLPEEYLENLELSKNINNAIKSLKLNQQKVISLYYIQELTMKEISIVLKISEPRVSQIHSSAIKKLKLALEKALN